MAIAASTISAVERVGALSRCTTKGRSAFRSLKPIRIHRLTGRARVWRSGGCHFARGTTSLREVRGLAMAAALKIPCAPDGQRFTETLRRTATLGPQTTARAPGEAEVIPVVVRS